MRDRLKDIIAGAEKHSISETLSPEMRTRVLRMVRSLRTTSAAHADDGPDTAFRLSRYLKRNETLPANFHWASLLDKAADPAAKLEDDFFGALASAKNEMLDAFIPDRRSVQARLSDIDVIDCLTDLLAEVESCIRTAPSGVNLVLHDYRDALANDRERIRQAARQYTVALAATSQQAAGKQLVSIKLDSLSEKKEVTFQNVIIDEAARANPLDLFIPMAMGLRRIILVGDHRQLPHIVEPDIRETIGNIPMPCLWKGPFVPGPQGSERLGVQRLQPLGDGPAHVNRPARRQTRFKRE